MIRVNKILFPTDLSECGNQALPYAIYLARNYKAELHVLHAMVLREDDIAVRLKEWAAIKMTTNAEACGMSRLKIKRILLRGLAAAPVILDYAQQNNVDLIVMGTHGRRGLRFLMLGSVADEVVRMAPCPVLTIRSQKSELSTNSLNRILLPVDFSNYALKALGYAKELATLFSAEIQFLHVIEKMVHPEFYFSARCAIFDPVPELHTNSVEELKKIIDEHIGPGISTSMHVVEGRAANEIAKFADGNHSELIVIATHGLTGIEHLLLGSVTEKVVRMASCPVLTVKAFGQSQSKNFYKRQNMETGDFKLTNSILR